jgi:putative membrane protein (TIGR04086 family)
MGRNGKKLWDSVLFGFGISVGFGLLCGFACCMICSAASYFIFNGMMFTGIFSYICLMVSGYCGGWLCGKYRRKFGLIEGAVCGGIMYGIILVISLQMGEFTSPVKLIVLGISGAFGGISGVNTIRPKGLM